MYKQSLEHGDLRNTFDVYDGATTTGDPATRPHKGVC